MNATEKKRSYKEYYALLHAMAMESGLDKETLEADLISQFCERKNVSRKSEMNDLEYRLMVNAMRDKMRNNRSSLRDVWRKRVMAVIYRYLHLTSQYVDLSPRDKEAVVKAIATRAAGIDFNKIDQATLQGIYNYFIKMNKGLDGSKIVTIKDLDFKGLN